MKTVAELIKGWGIFKKGEFPDDCFYFDEVAAADFAKCLDAAGYTIVPKEPTDEMITAMHRVVGDGNLLMGTNAYKAMLTAANELKD